MNKKQSIMNLYTKEVGIEAVYYIQSLGYKNAKLIGSLATVGFSNHDIDILIPLWRIAERKKCAKVLAHDYLLAPEYYYALKYEQVMLEGTCFGDINLFFY